MAPNTSLESYCGYAAMHRSGVRAEWVGKMRLSPTMLYDIHLQASSGDAGIRRTAQQAFSTLSQASSSWSEPLQIGWYRDYC